MAGGNDGVEGILLDNQDAFLALRGVGVKVGHGDEDLHAGVGIDGEGGSGGWEVGGRVEVGWRTWDGKTHAVVKSACTVGLRRRAGTDGLGLM